MIAATPDHQRSRFLALGDSYTIGEGVSTDEGWPAQLARRLRARGIELDDPAVVAKTGWTTDELSTAMDAVTFHPPYALVTLLIGVNNQYRGRDLANYHTELAVLLQRAITLAGTHVQRVVMVSTPDWGSTRFALEQDRDPKQIASEIDAFNAIASALANQAGTGFVDITAISRVCADHAGMLVADGLHPSVTQYALWSEAIIDAATHALGESRHARNG